MNAKTTPKPHPALIDRVRLYLIAQTVAEVKREQMDKIYNDLLQEIPLFNDNHPRVADGKRILCHKDMYLSKDEAACIKIWKKAHVLAVAQNIKPPDMPEMFCPALVAERLKCEAENLMLDEMGIALNEGENYHERVRYPKREKFSELVVKMVLSYVTENNIPFHPETAFAEVV